MQDKIINDTGLPETLNTLQNSTRDLVLPSHPKWNTRINPPISTPVVIDETPAAEDQDGKPDIPGKSESEQPSNENSPK